MDSTKLKLLNSANSIREAKSDGVNTAEKVGKLFVDIIESTDLRLTEHDSQLSNIIANANEIEEGLAVHEHSSSMRFNQINSNITEYANKIESILDSKGKNEGIAELDNSGIVPSRQLPPLNIVRFAGFVNNVSSTRGKTALSSTSPNCKVVFNNATKRFLLKQDIEATGDMSVYYTRWSGSRHFGSETPSGIRSSQDKLYLFNGEVYTVDDSKELVKSNKADVNALSIEIRNISTILNGLSFQVCENEEEYEVIAAGSGIDPNRVYFILDE